MGNADPDKRDWLLGKYNTYDHGPQDGTLFKYVDKNYQIYRCPSLDLAPPSANDGGFRGGSNGRFDYAVFLCFAGARLDRLPPSAHPPPKPQTGLPYSPEWVPTPVICEEGPYRINGFNTEGGHANVDQMAHNHNGGSYYMAPDGACHWYNEPWVNVNQYAANDWFAPGPSGKLQSLGAGLSWGQWDGK